MYEYFNAILRKTQTVRDGALRRFTLIKDA